MKKNTLLLLIMLFSVTFVRAQNDTTKIKLGDTKIIIIDKENTDNLGKLEKLEQGMEKFEKIIEEKENEFKKTEDQIKSLEKQIEITKDDKLKKELEEELGVKNALLNDLEKELDALEKGIEDIEDEIKDKEDDEEWNKDEHDDFNWDSYDDWYSDWDNMSPFGKDKRFRGHWAGFELGLNNYVNEDFKTTLNPDDELFELNTGRSWVWTINFLEFNIPFGKGVGLVTGMGTNFNNYHYRNNVNVREDINGIITATPELNNSYYKNTLNLWTATVPLIFEFQIPVDKRSPGIHIGFGVVGSAKLLSWGKQHYWADGNRMRTFTRSDFQINAFRYAATVRVGYRFLKLFANLDLVPLYKENRGPKVYPISVGLTLISF